MKKIIVTVSRRTDIPAYYADWFKARLELGYGFYPNPYSQKPVFIDLTPQAVKAFVFWTRNPKPLFKHLDYIDEKYEKRHYMHLTINGLPEALEKRNPKIEFAISSAEYLAKRYGPDYVQWRFDPIIFSSITSRDYILRTFESLTTKLEGITNRCYFSFVDLYEKTKRNFRKVSEKEEISFQSTGIAEQTDLVEEFISIAASKKISLYACAEDQLLETIPGLNKAHCVDADIIDRICSNGGTLDYDSSPSRIGCGCIESKDIGYYDSCPHGCIYCYANMDPEKAFENAKEYMLRGFPMDNLIKEELKDNQGKLFE